MRRILIRILACGWLLPGFLFFSLVSEASSVPGSLPPAACPGERISLNPGSGGETSILADFDGDRLPDVATGRLAGGMYRIEIRFSSDSTTCLVMNYIPPQATMYVMDVDGDNDLDLVVTDGFSLFPQAVWLGDGKGHFQDGNPHSWLSLFTAGQATTYRTGGFGDGLVLNGPTERLPLATTSRFRGKPCTRSGSRPGR